MLVDGDLLDVRDHVRMHHRQELNPVPDRGSLSRFGSFLFPTIRPSAARESFVNHTGPLRLQVSPILGRSIRRPSTLTPLRAA